MGGERILTIPALSSSGSAQVRGDSNPEADETFFMNLRHAVNGTIADDQATCTILNDE